MTPDTPLDFFNASAVRTRILARAAGDLPSQTIWLDQGAGADLDVGTADMLRGLCRDLRANQIDRRSSVLSSLSSPSRNTD